MSHENYQLLPANNQQTEAIQNVVFSVLREYGLEPGAIDFCLENIELNYFQKGGHFYVLVDEHNTIVATGGLYAIDKDNAEIRKMYLLPEHRGQGLGKWILTALIDKAKELGFQRIELETASVLKEAIGLYKKFGFQAFCPPHIAARCDQAYELRL